MNELNYYARIGETIKELRIKRRMTKTQLSNGICSPSYITRIENGERCPTSVILRQLTNKLGISPEDLFRYIESPTGLRVREVIKNLFILSERRDFKNVYNLIINEENKIEISSIHDLQIIEALRCISETALSRDYKSGIKKLLDVLNLTYNTGSTPTDIEFAILGTYGYYMLLTNQMEAAYNHYVNLKKHVNNINFNHSLKIAPRYYMYLIMACLDTNRLEEPFEYIDSTINYCKLNSTLSLLPKLYFLKGELLYRVNKENDFKIWLEKASSLNDLVKTSEDESFDTFVKRRLEITEELANYI